MSAFRILPLAVIISTCIFLMGCQGLQVTNPVISILTCDAHNMPFLKAFRNLSCGFTYELLSNMPVEIQQVRQEDAALLVLVENKSSRLIKITFPIATDFLRKGQYTIFPCPTPGNYKVIIAAYTEDRRYQDVYQPVSNVEVPVFLNGYDTIRAKGNFVGHYLEVTDGMLLPNRQGKK